MSDEPIVQNDLSDTKLEVCLKRGLLSINIGANSLNEILAMYGKETTDSFKFAAELWAIMVETPALPPDYFEVYPEITTFFMHIVEKALLKNSEYIRDIPGE